MVKAGVNNIVVNGHYKWQQIKDHLENTFKQDDIKIHFVLEPEILETGGGIMNIMERFDIDSALVSNLIHC